MHRLICPVSRLCEDEIAERLELCLILHRVRIDEERIERRPFKLVQNLHEATILASHIVWQHRYADATPHGAPHRHQVIDLQDGSAFLAIRLPHGFQCVEAREVTGNRLAESYDPMIVEIGDGLWHAELIEIGLCSEYVQMHREQAALDQVRLLRLPQAYGAIRLPGGKIEFLIGEHQLQVDLGIEVEKFLGTFGEPARPQPYGGVDAQDSGGPFRGFRQLALD